MPPTNEEPSACQLPPSSVTELPTALDRAIKDRDALANLESELVGKVPMVRLIVDHRVSGLNEAIEIAVQDKPGPGGANHSYALYLRPVADAPAARICSIEFQNGPIKESGFNGFTNEAILAVVIDRLRGFQHGRNPDGSFDFNSRGKYACRENALALTDLESALMWLQKRTRDRIARGVEGQNKL